ncbi:hypothetical protein ACH5RR_036960 [Cinchona calisaya]|uniref:RNase H type-1 domain-containing protein n=1 Tax=Cinchona calisaya TaxID=153742 RepID=A0ABD2Y718_9GENT
MGFEISFGFGTNMEAKALALLDGIRWRLHKNMSPVVVKIDSQILCNMFQGTALVPWSLHAFISHAKHFMSLGFFKIVHIFRETNTVPDALAKYASSSTNLDICFD